MHLPLLRQGYFVHSLTSESFKILFSTTKNYLIDESETIYTYVYAPVPHFPSLSFCILFFFSWSLLRSPNFWLTDFAVFSLPSFCTFTLIDCVPIAHTGCVVLTRFFRAFVICKDIVITACFQSIRYAVPTSLFSIQKWTSFY